MQASWTENKYKWYIADDSIEELRAPGKFKPEFTTRTGRYIGISPKCYCLEDDDQRKISTKGVPSSVDLDCGTFIGGLYDGETQVSREISLINYSRVTQTMVTKTITKKCINSCYLKFKANENLNQLSPLKIDNKYL